MQRTNATAMRVYCRCVHPNKVIRYLPAWGFPEGVVQQFGVTHHGAFEFSSSVTREMYEEQCGESECQH